MHFELDIPTMVLVLGITHLMQVLVFFYQYRINKTYKGVGWWLAWSAAEAAGFSFILLRNIPSILPVVILLQNSLIISGTVFLYFGVRKFLGMTLNLKLIIPVVALFLSGLIFFLWTDDEIHIRAIIISVTVALISFFTSYCLFYSKIRSIRSSLNFNAVIFFMHGLVFIYRTVMISNGDQPENFLTPTLFNFIPFFDALIASLLWTFGLIIMLNHRLNSEMSESREELQQIFNTSPDAAVISRLSDGLILDVNKGYTALSGYSREEIIGKSTLEIDTWKDLSDRNRVVEQLKEQGHCENYEAVFRLRNGEEITGLLSAKIINLQGVPYIISISHDISERKKAEKAIELKNQQLQQINAEKDRFFSIIAHDLRSPFTAFLGFTKIMTEELQSMTMDEIQRIAQTMRKSATNLFRLLENLLDWSRVQRGAIVFYPESFPVKQKIMECIETVSESAGKKEIGIEYDIPKDMQVVADIYMFQSIIRNLLSNAIKYTAKGGTVVLSVIRKENQEIEFSVKDNGIGMNQELISRLFGFDQKINRPGTDGEPSTGLGLIICKEFVEKHKGKIWVESEEGKGSVFFFTLS